MAPGSDARADGGSRAWSRADLDTLDRTTLEDVVFDLYDAEDYDVEWAAPNAEGDIVVVARKARLLRSTQTTVVAVTTAGTSVTPGSVDRLDYARGMNGADKAALIHPDDVPTDAHDAARGTRVAVVDVEALRTRLAATDLTP